MAAHLAYDMFPWYGYMIVGFVVFFPPPFLDCAFSLPTCTCSCQLSKSYAFCFRRRKCLKDFGIYSHDSHLGHLLGFDWPREQLLHSYLMHALLKAGKR